MLLVVGSINWKCSPTYKYEMVQIHTEVMSFINPLPESPKPKQKKVENDLVKRFKVFVALCKRSMVRAGCHSLDGINT